MQGWRRVKLFEGGRWLSCFERQSSATISDLGHYPRSFRNLLLSILAFEADCGSPSVLYVLVYLYFPSIYQHVNHNVC